MNFESALSHFSNCFQNYFLKTGMDDGRVLYFVSSMCAGLVSAILGTPADVVKTRMMNQPRCADGKGLFYANSIDCLRQAVAKVRRLFSGPSSFYTCNNVLLGRIYVSIQGVHPLLAANGALVIDFLGRIRRIV